MTVSEAQTELTALRSAMLLAVANGGVTSYMENGKSVTRDLRWLTDREKYLEAVVVRGTSGSWFASQFRNPE